ncbi:hypothetical protein KC734_00040 [candidate division KSB1 bacterium]|nr:hypothetical protein [candidate division KSB1 bacterium]
MKKFLAGCTLLLLFPATMVFSQQGKLISFELKDQFGREFSHEDFSGYVLVLVGSDKGGSTYNPLWAGAIHDSLTSHDQFDALRFIGVSDLRGVPFFLKGFVRSKFPKAKERWVLMDWKGIFPKAYQFEENHCNLLIFKRDGTLAYQTSVQDLVPDKMRVILTKLRSLLQADDPS